MSLKAKLEAVIYAAEEPVTLAQLASLFAGEALAWKAERNAAAAPTLEFPTEAAVAGELADSTEEIAGVTAVVEDTSEAAPQAELAEGPDTAESPDAAESVEALEVADPVLEAKRDEKRRDRDVREILRGLLDELIADYASESRGLEIREIAGGFRMGTKPEIHDAVRAFVKSLKPAMKLSLPALETLAVIAYKQPVTAPEVGEIRGVDSAGVLGSLLSRKLIATAGRKQVIGRPILYKTTKEFLLRFGLKDLNDLPSMEEFEKMAALELSEGDETEEPAAVEQSGDLFAEPEASDESSAEIDPFEEPTTTTETEPSIPTAESSSEPAEAHALVERQNAEEVEAEV
jgi:segregation and condensation protein B